MKIFLSLPAPTNFFMCEMTEMSMGTSGASPSARTHGWLSACAAVMRLRVSIVSMRLMRFLAELEMRGHGGLLKFTRPLRISLKIAVSVWPQKGGCPHRQMYTMTPTDQTSAAGPYRRRSTSGAT